MFPAIHSSRPDVVSALKGQAGQPSGARAAARFRALLATAQIALATLLLVSAGLFTKSLFNVSRIDLGLKADNLIGFGVSPSLNGYISERSRELFERLEDELRALPGVVAASGSSVQILAGNNWGSNLSVEGFDAGPDTDTRSQYNEVGPNYFRTLGIPGSRPRIHAIRCAQRAEGRHREPGIRAEVQPWTDVVGKHIGNRNENSDSEIVGLVQDAKYSEVKREIPRSSSARIGRTRTLVPEFLRPNALDPGTAAFEHSAPRRVARSESAGGTLRTMPQQV